jgi:predicted ATPase
VVADVSAPDLARIAARTDDFVLITGCSGGGKSTLLAELAARGFHTCEEPGRRIVHEETERGGDALPWVDLRKFAIRAARLALDDLAGAARRDGLTIFDRGLIDAVCGLQRFGAAVPPDIARAFAQIRYASTVFLAPPWTEIFSTDSERRHGLADARIEYDDLARRLPGLGYAPVLLPKTSVATRADFVVARLT